MHELDIQHKETFGSPTQLNSYTHVYSISISQSENSHQDGLIKQAVGSEATQNMEGKTRRSAILRC